MGIPCKLQSPFALLLARVLLAQGKYFNFLADNINSNPKPA